MVTKDQVNILMVDDQPGKLLSYEVMLGDLGENLIKANSAKEALEVLLKTEIAVVLMDVSMPELDGFQLAAMIRQHPRFQQTAIIFVSAVHLTDLDQLKGYEHGAVDYISVPVIPQLLRAKVRVFADLHRKTRQLETLNRDLEKRVLERTDELANKAELLLRLNVELIEKNQELDAIVHTAPDIIFSRQPDGSRDYISDRFYDYTGAAPGSANGFGWLDYVHEGDKDPAMKHWLLCVESGAMYEAEYRLRAVNGAYRWFRARALPIRDESGKILKWYGSCSDIHDSKVLEQSIRDSAAELEKIVDNRTDELRRLSVRLMSLQDEERRRIARDLHDGLGQELAVAKMVLDKMLLQKTVQPTDDSWAQASSIVERAIQQVRTMSHLLHPPLLDEVGLLSALAWYTDGLAKRSGIETTLTVQPRDFPRLASEVETAVFRIVQEALTNVFRHSEAHSVAVALAQTDGMIKVTVRDDGKGITNKIAELRSDSVGVGIGGMKQRAKELGGELRLTNIHPGTLVELEIPYNSAAREASEALGRYASR
ncbi:MAG TPA: PAS domain-containing protein [Candidatus Aquilonibacter sp.]|jgi:PAS domain S-box-containing protein|nr:PAS domain-containing protein [Candidatus Aquilonibacter sp.]